MMKDTNNNFNQKLEFTSQKDCLWPINVENPFEGILHQSIDVAMEKQG